MSSRRGYLIFLVFIFASFYTKADRLSDLLSNSSQELTPTTLHMLESDLLLLKSMKGAHSSQLSDKIFNTHGVFDGTVYLNFLLDRVEKIKANGCPPEGVACQVPGEKTSHITTLYSVSPAADRLSMLLHESIHGSGAFGQHAACPKQLLDENNKPLNTTGSVSIAGLNACVSSIDDPYIAQIIFLQNLVSNCENCSDETKDLSQKFIKNLKYLVIEPEVLKTINEDK